MARYTADSKDRVREAADMIAIVSARTELRRAGADEYVGRCPFHEERTPSFGVDPHKKVYHCFGCQASGDVFSFVMETEGLDFAGALESLAQRSGIELETEEENPRAAERRKRRERLHELLGRTADYYARYLWDAREAQPAREYLLGRGLSEEILREFRVGYAPSAWDRILLASRKAGFSEEELLATGLAQRSRSRPGQVFDRFRERIMFPSADARGRVVGFGARAMRDNQPPKYLNTSDGEIYHKRAQLFGIHLARASASRAGRVVLVEGYTDVLALHQAGLRNAVGIMGTALTEEQVAELERVAKVLELALDSDRAGQDAMLRAAGIASGRKLELRVVALPEGMDPAELIERQGADALRARVEQSVPFAAFRVDRILAGADTGSAEGRDRAVAELAPVLAELPPSVLREELVRRVAGRLDLSQARLAALLSGEGRDGGGLARPAGAPPGAGSGSGPGPGRSGSGDDDAQRPVGGQAGRGTVEPLDTSERAERRFLAVCVALPEAGAAALASVDLDGLIRSERLRRAARHLCAHTAAPLADLPPDDEDLARTIAGLVAHAGRAGRVTAERIEHERLV
ncbi:MAG: primase, partial [Solirubrobacteraceae bacterium]|nr:primase [Solirubrobacteraceae bacterium]